MRLVKKAFSLVASSLAVLILSGFLSLRPIGGEISLAHHAANHACNDITGSTTPVLSPDMPGRAAGVEDSGRLNFDANPPAIDYQACGETAQSSAGGALADGLVVGGVTGNLLRGWVWDTNLGYVSLNCEGGANLGGRCGDQNYQTIIASDGQVHGWAWGDNIGWMSMRCKNGKNLGLDCGAARINYDGVKVAQDAEIGGTRENCAIARRGDFYGYAWTETVGWVDFCGAHVELTTPLVPSVTLIPAPTGNGGPGDGGGGGGDPGPDGIPGTGDEGDEGAGANPCSGTVYANGSDSCKIVVQIKEGDTVLTAADLASRGINVTDDLHVTELAWNNRDQTTLRADQVTRCSQADVDEGLSPCTYNGSILPSPEDFAWSESDLGIVANVRAIAPTSLTDQIILESLTIRIGDAAAVELSRGDVFSFRPAVAVTRIVSPDSPPSPDSDVQDSVFAMNNIPTEHKITVAAHRGGDASRLPENSLVKIYTQLHDCSDDFDFIFDELGVISDTDAESDKFDEAINFATDEALSADRPNIDRAGSVCSEANTISDIALDINGSEDGTLEDNGYGIPLSDYLSAAEGTLSHDVYTKLQSPTPSSGVTVPNALGFLTRVEYTATGGQAVRYFSRIVKDGSLLNQAADIRGNVRILQETSGLPSSRGERRTIGERFLSTRELFAKTIEKFGRGQLREESSHTFTNSNISPGAQFYKRPSASTEPCKIIFDNAGDADISFSGNTTVQSTGCDVYFMDNVRPDSGSKLGIIALEDLTMTGARKGGFVYICGKVTDLENVHIAADRSVLPFGELAPDINGNLTVPACGTTLDDRIHQNTLPDESANPRAGLPKFDHPVREVLKNQLTIVGSIRSNNTDGGASKNPPESGDGTKILPQSGLRDTARFYDWNFIRYSKTKPDPTYGTCWADDVDLSGLLEPDACDNNEPVNSAGSVNIRFQEPTGLPIFKDAAQRR